MSELTSELSERAAGGDPVALTRAMVAIPSVNPVLEEGGAGEEAMARACGGWLESWGFHVRIREVAPGRLNVVAVHRGKDPGAKLILNGHLDTVGVEGMAEPPFDGRISEEKVWGRGACDMKGGLAIILATAATLARDGHPGELVVALTADEEHASLRVASDKIEHRDQIPIFIEEPDHRFLLFVNTGRAVIQQVERVRFRAGFAAGEYRKIIASLEQPKDR